MRAHILVLSTVCAGCFPVPLPDDCLHFHQSTHAVYGYHGKKVGEVTVEHAYVGGQGADVESVLRADSRTAADEVAVQRMGEAAIPFGTVSGFTLLAVGASGIAAGADHSRSEAYATAGLAGAAVALVAVTAGLLGGAQSRTRRAYHAYNAVAKASGSCPVKR